MYICEHCGRRFEEPSRGAIDVGECWGSPYTEYADCCPICGSFYIEKEEDEDDDDQ